METVAVTTLSQKFNQAWETYNWSAFTEILHEVENNSLDDIENFLIHVIKKTKDVKCRSVISKTKRTLFWTLIFQKGLHRRIFNRRKSFVGLLVEYRNINVLLQLLHEQSKPNLRDTGFDGNTLLHHLCENNWKGAKLNSSLTLYFLCMKLLLKSEVIDVNAYNYARKTAMDLAMEKGNKEAAKSLIEDDGVIFRYPKELHHSFMERIKQLVPDVQLRDDQLSDEGLLWPKLHYELMKKNLSFFEADFKACFDVDHERLTILLQEACKGGLTEPVQLLLNSGADPFAVDEYNDGRSAVAVARELHHEKILPMLLRPIDDSCPGTSSDNKEVSALPKKPVISSHNKEVSALPEKPVVHQVKRAQTDISHVTIEESPVVKKPKLVIMVVIIPVDYPNQEMSSDDAVVLQEALVNKILSAEVSDDRIQFQDTKYVERRGFLKMTCANEFSYKFLADFLAKENMFKVVYEKDLPTRNRIVIDITPQEQTDKLFALLEKQNKGLSCAKWFSISGYSKQVVAIDSKSLQFLEGNEWKLYYGANRVNVNKIPKRK